ncbi:MAG: hypothetical protein P4L22_00290 [Candidatus Babeliales bacterium]|nr:hypothetical protein [Candidatus Babeliales bacterium]
MLRFLIILCIFAFNNSLNCMHRASRAIQRTLPSIVRNNLKNIRINRATLPLASRSIHYSKFVNYPSSKFESNQQPADHSSKLDKKALERLIHSEEFILLLEDFVNNSKKLEPFIDLLINNCEFRDSILKNPNFISLIKSPDLMEIFSKTSPEVKENIENAISKIIEKKNNEWKLVVGAIIFSIILYSSAFFIGSNRGVVRELGSCYKDGKIYIFNEDTWCTEEYKPSYDC